METRWASGLFLNEVPTWMGYWTLNSSLTRESRFPDRKTAPPPLMRQVTRNYGLLGRYKYIHILIYIYSERERESIITQMGLGGYTIGNTLNPIHPHNIPILSLKSSHTSLGIPMYPFEGKASTTFGKAHLEPRTPGMRVDFCLG